MSKASMRQRTIATDDLRFPGYMRAPHEAKPTAQGLWLHTDLTGRRELVPELIAADIYPGQAAVPMVIDHLLMLEESGFLTIYQARGSEWISLRRTLKADTRTAPPSDCPPPPGHDSSRHVVALEGESARERAEARVRAEQVERDGEWAAWRERAERAAPPRRPLLLDAPPIGCVDHPNGRRENCGPCGTARRQHDRWLAQQRYTDQLVNWETQADGPGDEPW